MPKSTPKVKRTRSRSPAPPVVHPIQVPSAATHFRLRKGGRNAPPCTIMTKEGVDEQFHPIELFTVPQLTTRWGYDSNYWVQFSAIEDGRRNPLGASKRLSIRDPADLELTEDGIPVPGGMVLPAPFTSGVEASLQGPLSMMMALKEVATKDTEGQVLREQARSDGMLRLMQENGKQVTDMQMRMFEMMQRPPSGPSAEVSALVTAVTTLSAAVARLEARANEDPEPDPDEPEDEEDETDDEKIQRVMKSYRKNGASAFLSLASEETIENVLRLLPKLKAKLPDVIAKFGPMLQARLDEALRPPPVVTTVTPATPPPEIRVRTKAKTSHTNGAPPPPPPHAPQDEHTPRVE